MYGCWYCVSIAGAALALLAIGKLNKTVAGYFHIPTCNVFYFFNLFVFFCVLLDVSCVLLDLGFLITKKKKKLGRYPLN